MPDNVSFDCKPALQLSPTLEKMRFTSLFPLIFAVFCSNKRIPAVDHFGDAGLESDGVTKVRLFSSSNEYEYLSIQVSFPLDSHPFRL